MSDDFDVLIIGSGAGGGMTAHALCEQGFNVGLIERGKRFNPQKDYILNYDDWESRSNPLKKARRPEQSINQRYQTPIMINGKVRHRSALIYHRVYGVGGSTLHYQGEAHRFAEHAFNTRQTYGWGVDWPINYSDLAPHYQKAEQLLGVAGQPGNPFKPERGAFPTPAHPLSARSQILAESAERIGMSLLANTLALPSVSFDGRLACQHSGGCNFGCVFSAKSSVDQALIPKAEKTGNLTLLTEARVLKLVLDGQGEIEAVQCKNRIGHYTLSARVYVLAGGAVETPRLLLHSQNAAHPNGFANQHDQVGRYFMETVIAFHSIMLSADITTYRGPPLDSRVWDFCKPADNSINGFVLGAAGYLYPSFGPTHHAIRTKGIGRAHKTEVRKTFGRKLRLFGIAEQQPRADNRITLSEYRDDAGVPKVNIHSAYSNQDIHTIKVMKNKLKDWANATATKEIGRARDSRYQSSATHVGGTCRMGNNPKHSVVDAFGKVHESRNCYITDASVLPTQGAGDSPSLTIQALALRTADKIAADLNA